MWRTLSKSTQSNRAFGLGLRLYVCHIVLCQQINAGTGSRMKTSEKLSEHICRYIKNRHNSNFSYFQNNGVLNSVKFKYFTTKLKRHVYKITKKQMNVARKPKKKP